MGGQPVSYAIRKDGLGWRAVNGPEDVGPDEAYSENQPVPGASQVKAARWDAIKAKRDAVSGGGVKVGTKWYHTDETSRAKYLGLVRMADAAVAAGGAATATLQYGGQDIQWKTMDGSFIKMTVQRANDVFNAVSGLDFTAFAAAETHRVAMEASANPFAYDFANGWPATFGG
jgi:hypothetical protein